MIADHTGALSNVKRHDYLPFGEELRTQTGRSPAFGYATDTTRQKFTSYERDVETELDFAKARYYSKLQGRFISVDPLLASARRGNPQTWNRYSYVSNRPLSLVDPTGMRECTPQAPCFRLTEEEAARATTGVIEATVNIDITDQTPLETPSVVLGTTIEMRSIEPAEGLPSDSNPSCGACAEFIPHMSARAKPMKQILEVGAVIATAEIAAPIILIEAAGAGAASLGIEAATLDTAVIGSEVNTAAYLGQAGFNVLRVTSEYAWQTSNVPWLNSIIKTGQSVIVLSGNLYTRQEVQYLQRFGSYVWNSDSNKLVPK